MNRSFLRHVAFLGLNTILALSIAAFCLSALWEFSTEEYLSGFADAVVPAAAAPIEKVGAILDWIATGPSRAPVTELDPLLERDPRSTLNYRGLLSACGSASNAFVNLARRSGLRSRRLLLFDSQGNTTHVVAEVQIRGQWIVVDPLFHFIARDASGRLLTREDLRDPQLLREATSGVKNYLPIYDYTWTGHIRLNRIPLLGFPLQRNASGLVPAQVSDWDWTLPLERESFAALLLSLVAILTALGIRRLCRHALLAAANPLAQSLSDTVSHAPSPAVVHNQ